FLANETARKIHSGNIITAQVDGSVTAEGNFSALMDNQGKVAGVRFDGIRYDMNKSGDQRSTSSALDLAIEGKGYFILGQGEGNIRYSRVGNFVVDPEEGTLMREDSNLKVQGYGINANGEVNTATLTDIKINQAPKPAKATDTLTTIGELSATAAAPSVLAFDATDKGSYTLKKVHSVFDSNGTQHDFYQYFVKDVGDPKKWTVHYQLDNQDAGTAALTFDSTTGKLVVPARFKAATNTVTLADAQPMTIDIDYTNLTRSGDKSEIRDISNNGYASSKYDKVKIDATGGVYAKYADGKELQVGQIVLADFAAESELTRMDGPNWQQSDRSGKPTLIMLKRDSITQLKSQHLEGSNINAQSEMLKLMSIAEQNSSLSYVLTNQNRIKDTLMNAVNR
ncbi:flagellar hook-basal body protein, partial [Candidatus Regiella insecticola 5.15]